MTKIFHACSETKEGLIASNVNTAVLLNTEAMSGGILSTKSVWGIVEN